MEILKKLEKASPSKATEHEHESSTIFWTPGCQFTKFLGRWLNLSRRREGVCRITWIHVCHHVVCKTLEHDVLSLLFEEESGTKYFSQSTPSRGGWWGTMQPGNKVRGGKMGGCQSIRERRKTLLILVCPYKEEILLIETEHDHLLSTYLQSKSVAINSFSIPLFAIISFALGLTCTQASIALAALSIQPHLLSGQFAIRPHFALQSQLLSILICY